MEFSGHSRQGLAQCYFLALCPVLFLLRAAQRQSFSVSHGCHWPVCLMKTENKLRRTSFTQIHLLFCSGLKPIAAEAGGLESRDFLCPAELLGFFSWWCTGMHLLLCFVFSCLNKTDIVLLLSRYFFIVNEKAHEIQLPLMLLLLLYSAFSLHGCQNALLKSNYMKQ